jgi:hypothetical protein
MSREAGWALALLPSRSCVSWRQISNDTREVAAGPRRCQGCFIVGNDGRRRTHEPITADLRRRDRPNTRSGDEGPDSDQHRSISRSIRQEPRINILAIRGCPVPASPRRVSSATMSGVRCYHRGMAWVAGEAPDQYFDHTGQNLQELAAPPATDLGIRPHQHCQATPISQQM